MTHTKHTIRAILRSSNNALRCKAIKRGLVRLASFQTADERAGKFTKYDNNRGFSVATVKRGTELARKVAAGQFLTRAELEEGARICSHHAGQLAEFANGFYAPAVKEAA